MLKWLALIAALFLPLAFAPQSWLLAYLAQTATMIVFALSYNLLLGETGLLSFGHAAYAGLGAFAAAHVFNRYGVALPLVPLIGGAAGAGAGVLFGFISTRRAGTPYAMITLGIGELVAACVWLVPGWFGGEGGVPVDRASGPPFFTWTFGPAREAYALIAAWCVLACIAMYAFSRTPTTRLANAVRDNAARVASIGFDPRRVRFTMSVVSAFFAGVAGAMALINVELASAEGVGLARSGSVLIATVIGGTSSFFGPIAGAALLTFFSVAVASVSPAWLLYLGLFFFWVVVALPNGLCALAARRVSLRIVPAASAWMLAIVVASETAYAMQFDTSGDGLAQLAGFTLDGRTPMPWLIALACAVLAALLTRWAKR
ncbi:MULTISPECIES: branched-chain amino acid ABC transporter permease [unclassified Caballeronia]|uniref:branched-chain amino acid ABC transporter permease n=1 Tax=unclassified Caballeronia TaxID=2646786 RepID=UPI0028585AA2|nr:MULTISPECIES: branched-chain amino acid ABC transporter permease [unclassified Caballeronia]MDR5751057.1 branched-chain amino acid ABC transporter permease [Caballeronia sp. LZ024]MDR5844808.1 branched-chain amino acid ABC transporter permease [Caballeronia sp. LZ031]